MHPACLAAAVVVGTVAGYLLHSVRSRMSTAREHQELAALKVRAIELHAVIAQVCGLVDRFEAQKLLSDRKSPP